MASFSIDDVRDTFQADISIFIGKIETLGRALLGQPPPLSPATAEIQTLESLADCLHTIYGTSTLVGAKSLGDTAQQLERLAEAGHTALRRLEEERAKAREVTELCLEGARQMRSMLALELAHQRPQAEESAEAFRVRRLERRAAAAPIRSLRPEAPERVPATGAEDPPVEPELLDVFREEAADAAAEIEVQIQQLSAHPDDVAAASRIEQIFHSLKGAAATVGLESARRIAASWQSRMHEALEGDLEVNADLLAKLGAAVRQLRAASQGASAGELTIADRDVAVSVSADDDGGGAPSSMRSELLDVFQQEARESLGTLGSLLRGLAESPDDLAAARDVERLFHTLKGAAATVGLRDVSRIAAGVQARMEGVLEGGAAISHPDLQEIIDRTNEMVHAAGLDELALRWKPVGRGAAANETEGARGQKAAQQVFADEARQICQRALSLARELPHATAEKAQAMRTELERIFHRLKGSALITTDPAVAVEAERLQRRAGHADAASLVADVQAAVARLASLLDLKLNEPSRDGAEPAPSLVRESVQLPDPELWESFSQECVELLDGADRLILDLESTDQPKRILESLLRQYHTLKGATNTVGLVPTGRALHQIEDFLESLIARPILPSMKSVTSLLLWVQADTRRQLKTCQRGWVEVTPGAIEALIARVAAGGALVVASRASLRAPASTSVREAAASVDSGGEASLGGRERGADRKYIRVATERLDSLMNLAGELVVSRSRLMSRVSVLGGLRQELGARSRRLLEMVDGFREQHEFSIFAPSTPARPAVVPSAADTMQRVPWSGFTDLELDHYDDVNLLARGLAEVTDDLNALNGQLVRELAGFTDDSDAFGTIVNGIQGEVTRARMVPLEFVFARLRVPAREAAEREAKEVRVVTSGEGVSLDKAIADALFAPMLHLVRNAVAHGIEAPEARARAGKPRAGVLTMGAREESGQIVLEVTDDGAGLDLKAMHARGIAMGLIGAGTAIDDPAVKDLVFAHGFSTRATAGSVSGRGVGCDVARREIERLNGSIRVETTRSEGTTFVLSLPVTLAITKALLVRHRGRTFALPLHFADRIVDAEDAEIVDSAGLRRMKVEGGYIPVRRMDPLFRLGDGSQQSGPLVVLRVGAERIGLQVDALVGQEEIVVKSAGDLLAGHPLFAGATIRGTGELALILDVPALVASSAGRAEKLAPGPVRAAAPEIAAPRAIELPAKRQRAKLRVLFVDDSLSVRRVAEKMLAGLGADVTLATDGFDALARLREAPFDIVFTDLEMPRMHGYDLLRELRFLPAHKELPVVIVSSRSGQKHQDQARALGANDYITKPFSPQTMESALRRWCARAEAPAPGAERTP
jgi:chemosensory pili system protein ChpA (sensor histidine kinase/response regulator)